MQAGEFLEDGLVCAQQVDIPAGEEGRQAVR